MSAGADTFDADSGRFRLASPVGSELIPEVGDRAARVFLAMGAGSRVVTGTDARTQAAEEREQTSAPVSRTASASAPIGAMRCRSEATETERCAVGKTG